MLKGKVGIFFVLLIVVAASCFLASVLAEAAWRMPGASERPGSSRWEDAAAPKILPSEELIARGHVIYGVRCALCHGKAGDGKGPAHDFLSTPPRDFRQGTFKFRTTANGELPTDEDLFRTITVGFPAYGMPSFEYLSVEDRWAVVHYLKSFSDEFKEQKEPLEEVDLGDAPKPTTEFIAQGKEIFKKAQCAQCHGETGVGFGPSAAYLKDSWEHPILPLDLGKEDVYFKRGASAKDTMRTLSTGLNGTPMPSYLEAGFTKEELWALAHYVRSLSEKNGQTKGEK